MDGDSAATTTTAEPPGGWPLRRYLTLLLALFVVSTGTGVSYTWAQSEQDALAAAHDDATFGAEQAARQIGEVQDSVRGNVDALAANPAITQAFTRPKECQLSFQLFSGLDSGHLDVLGADGTVPCSSRPPTGTGYQHQPWLPDAVRKPLMIGPLTDQRTGHQALLISQPLAAGRGAVVAFVDLEGLGAELANLLGGPHHLMFLVLSADGRTVITRSAEAARWIGTEVRRTRFAEDSGNGSGRDLNGVRRVYGRAVAPKVGWRVHAGADRAAALADAHRLVRRQGLILAAGLIAGLIATWLVYRRITRPIGLLSTAVRAGTPTAIAGPREVAALAAEFSNLVADVDRQLDERRRAEHEARELERNYRQLFDSNPHPMYVFDTETLAFVEVNDATSSYYGHPRTALLTMRLTDLTLPEDAAALAQTVARATTVEQWGPLRQVKADGSVVTVTITSHLLSFQGRQARCAVLEDITEKEQLERRLHQSQRLESLGQLAGGVAHDFNNLLSIIIGYATMCAQDVEALAHTEPAMWRIHSDLGQILTAGDRATNLTRQLLAFARHDVAQTTVLDLNPLVAGVEELLRRSIGEDIVLRVELTDEPWPIRADAGQIEQVLLNLAVNARDAMPAGGTLTIDTEPIAVDEHYAAHHPGIAVGRHMRLRVSDTGTGMSQETIDRAFEPFFTTKPKGKGTGLGLATIYGIVTRAGGHAQIYSELGVGTTFTALFPVTTDAVDTPATAPDADLAQYQARENETILVAEDEDSLRLLTERILVRHGYRVLLAADGLDAVEVAERHPDRIDLLLTDVIMPRLGGHDLAVRIQETRPGLPVIYMSGYAEPLLAARSTLPQGVTLLSKPATEEQILATLRRALDAAGSHRAAHPAR